MDLFRVRSKVSGLFLRVPGGELGWRIQELVEQAPVTRASWWLLKPLAGFDGQSVVAYEDRCGLWWEYMPATGRIHNIPWLSTEFHYDRPRYSRARLTRLDAKQLIEQGVGRAADDQFLVAHHKDLTARDPKDLLGRVRTAWSRR